MTSNRNKTPTFIVLVCLPCYILYTSIHRDRFGCRSLRLLPVLLLCFGRITVADDPCVAQRCRCCVDGSVGGVDFWSLAHCEVLSDVAKKSTKKLSKPEKQVLTLKGLEDVNFGLLFIITRGLKRRRLYKSIQNEFHCAKGLFGMSAYQFPFPGGGQI